MAKKAYIGINGVARKVKKGYIGVNTQVPTYDTQNVSITASNISTYFTVTNGSYYFVGSGNTFTTNNSGIDSSTASTTLTAKSDMSSVSFSYSYSSEQNYDKFTLIVAETTVANAVSGATTNKTWSGSLKAGEKIEFKYVKDGSGNVNDDKCTFSAMTCTAIVQTGSTTKSVARKVKKAYIGVGGVARPCWSGGELAYYGVVSGSRNAAYAAKGTSVGNYALFGGGRVGTSWDGLIKNVICVSGSLTDTAVSSLDKAVINHAAGSIGDYALFMGGCIGSASYQKTVTAYSASLTKSAATALASARGEIGAANVGEYLLCGSGIYYDYAYEFAKDVDVYNASLTKTTTNTAIVGSSVAGQTPSYAIFTPTDRASSATTCDAFNASLTRTQKISFLHNHPSASASVGNYAIFMGHNNNRYFDAVDDSLTAHMTPLPTSVTNVTYFTGMGGASIGDYALFAGGYTESVVSKAFSVDASLTIQVQPSLRFARQYLAAAVIKGEKALFYGGQNDSTVYDTIDVYTV